MASSFYVCFQGRLNDLGMPAPEGIFQTLGTTTATIAAIAKPIATFGTEVTLTELAVAGILTETLAVAIGQVAIVVGGLTASFYVGVCLGALSGCTGEVIGDALSVAKAKYNFYRIFKFDLSEDLTKLITHNPEMRGAKKNATFAARSRFNGYGDFSGSSRNTA